MKASLDGFQVGSKAHENPFRVSRIEALPFRFSKGVSWFSLLQRVMKNGFRGAIVGDHGSGKSTLVEELQLRLEEKGKNCHLIRLNDEKRKLSILDKEGFRSSDIVFLDGAEQLSFLNRRSLLSGLTADQGLILTSHQPTILPTLYECRTSVSLFRDLVFELAPDLRLEPQELEQIYSFHKGNLRHALFHLYDRAA